MSINSSNNSSNYSNGNVLGENYEWTNSLYCPRVPVEMSKQELTAKLEEDFDLKVERVDMNNNVSKGCIRAFIHLKEWTDDVDRKTKQLKKALMTQSTPFVWKVSHWYGEPLFLFINHKPIPTVVHTQVPANQSAPVVAREQVRELIECREQIDQQNQMIEQLIAQIIEQNRNMDIMSNEIRDHKAYIQQLFQQTEQLTNTQQHITTSAMYATQQQQKLYAQVYANQQQKQYQILIQQQKDIAIRTGGHQNKK